MTAVDALAFLLNQLYDMVSILSLNDAAHTLRIIQIKCHVCKLRHQLTTTHKAQLTTTLRAFCVLRIEPR